MSIDKADAHYCGDFPEDLDYDNCGTHIGMYLTWIINRNLEGDMHREESSEALADVRARRMTGRDFLFEEQDGKFWDEDLNQEGLEFTEWYYASDDWLYYNDYNDTLGDDLESLYEVENTWENYNLLEPVIDRRFAQWRKWRYSWLGRIVTRFTSWKRRSADSCPMENKQP